jgi:hypothetical protein
MVDETPARGANQPKGRGLIGPASKRFRRLRLLFHAGSAIAEPASLKLPEKLYTL